jgi:hypothetical protein
LKRQEEEIGKWIPERFGTFQEGPPSRIISYRGTQGREKTREEIPCLSLVPFQLPLAVPPISQTQPNPTKSPKAGEMLDADHRVGLLGTGQRCRGRMGT